MAPRALLWPDPRIKPPFGAAEIDRGHPLARGLSIFMPFNEGAGEAALDMVTGIAATVIANAPDFWRAGTSGVGVAGSTATLRLNRDPLSGLASFALVTWLDKGSSVTTNSLLGIGRWNTPNTLLNRDEDGGTTVRAILAFSGGNIDLSVNGTWASGRNTLCHNVTAASLTTYTNGVSRGTGASSGTMTATSGGFDVFISNSGSHVPIGPAPTMGVAAAAWTRALSASEILWLHAEPYAMLRPIVRRRYFVPAAAGGAGMPTLVGERFSLAGPRGLAG